MKNFKSLWVGLAAVALVATGCDRNDPVAGTGNGDGDLVVNIKRAASTRAILGDSNEDQIAAFESNVVEFTAYLFDETGTFLQQKSTSAGASQIVFPGFEAGDQLQVVVVANSVDAGVTLPTLTEADGIADVTDGLTVTLQSQMTTDFTDLEKGLLMSGQYGADATTGNGSAVYTVIAGANPVEVNVERVVARVELGNISFGSDVTIADLVKFQINGAGVQKAISNSFIAPGEITTIPTDANVSPATMAYYGSFTGGTSTELAGLNEMGQNGAGLVDLSGLIGGLIEAVIAGLDPITGLVTKGILAPVLNDIGGLLDGTISGLDTILGLLNVKIGTLGVNLGELIVTPDAFWYVLPNNGSVNPTLLTIAAEYDGVNYYYPVIINSTTGSTNTDGTYIKRNTRYVINLTFNGLIGTDTPDDPSQGTNVIVTVAPIDWEGPITQDATW